MYKTTSTTSHPACSKLLLRMFIQQQGFRLLHKLRRLRRDILLAGWYSAGLNVWGTEDYALSLPRNGYQYSARGDYYISQRDRIYGMVNRQ